MIGLIALAILIVYIVGLVVLSRFVTKSLPIPAGWKTLLRALIVVAAFPLSVADEIIGKYQFQALCKAHGIDSADLSKARRKQVKIHDIYTDWRPIASTILPMEKVETLMKDSETDEILARYENYRSDGGWLMRNTGLSMGNRGPIIFDGSTCDWSIATEALKVNGISWIKN